MTSTAVTASRGRYCFKLIKPIYSLKRSQHNDNYNQCGEWLTDVCLLLLETMATVCMYCMVMHPKDENIWKVSCSRVAWVINHDYLSILNDHEDQVWDPVLLFKYLNATAPSCSAALYLRMCRDLLETWFSWICTLGFPWNESRLFSKAKQIMESASACSLAWDSRSASSTNNSFDHRGPTGCQVWWLLWISHCKLQHA